MYESPLTMYMSDIQTEIQKQQEEEVMVSVKQSIGYDVDKLELIKALQYDREQYTKGYSDCKSDMLAKVRQARKQIIDEKDFAYADFERYKVECLGQEWEDAYDSLPQDDYRYGMERCLEILDKIITESEEK